MRVYIRHGERVSESNDSPITRKSAMAIESHIKALLQTCPPPRYLIVSPYLRCRQTASVINQSLPHPVPMKIDTNISSKSRALVDQFECPSGNCQGMLDLHTLKHNPPLYEEREDVYNRISEHLKETRNEENVWIVAHKGCIADILTLCGKKPVYVRPLQGLILGDSDHIQMFDTGIF